MPVRATMSDLITKVRVMIDDPSDGSTAFTDQYIQDTLDRCRSEVRYGDLEPLTTITSSGSLTYLQYSSAKITDWPWESDAVLYDASFTALVPSAVDYLIGLWTFAAHTMFPVMIVGKIYDINRAAADLLEEWASKLKLEYDFSSDDQKFLRKQKREMCLSQAQVYRRRQAPVMAKMFRGDMRA